MDLMIKNRRRRGVRSRTYWYCCCEKPEESGFSVLMANITKVVVPIVVIWSLLVVGMNMKARTLVEAVFVSKDLSDSGMSDSAAQRALVSALQKVISDARETMPGDIKDEIEADEPEPEVDVPGTGVSIQSIIQYTKQAFHLGDVTIRSTFVKKGALFAVHVYVTGASSDVDKQTDFWPSATEALSAAADVVMHLHNKFILASALATRERADCYKAAVCPFAKSIPAFDEVLQDGGYRHYYKWSWLALSKIDEDRHMYAAEVTKALLAVRNDRQLFWAYYNWGIGLSEQGCDPEALEAFQAALAHRPMADFVNNAAGRQALILAAEEEGVDEKSRKHHLILASGYLMTATQLNPDYAEAYVNLGKVLARLIDKPDPADVVRNRVKAFLDIDDKRDATDAFDAVILSDSAQVRRASYFSERTKAKIGSGLHPKGSQFASMIGDLQDAHTEDPVCHVKQLADTMKESKGCLTDAEKQFDDEAGIRLATMRKESIPSGQREACENQSIAATLGDAPPRLVAPVY